MFTSTAEIGASPILAAVGWIEQILTGSVGTSVAIMAIALVGIGMLDGRVGARRAMQVILGCFLLFGAPGIGKGLSALTAEESQPGLVSEQPTPAVPKASADPTGLDPYAGVAVPM